MLEKGAEIHEHLGVFYPLVGRLEVCMLKFRRGIWNTMLRDHGIHRKKP